MCAHSNGNTHLQVFSRFGAEVPAVLFRLERPSPICLRRDDDGGFIGLFVRVAQEAAVTVNTNVLALKVRKKWMMDFCMCYLALNCIRYLDAFWSTRYNLHDHESTTEEAFSR